MIRLNEPKLTHARFAIYFWILTVILSGCTSKVGAPPPNQEDSGSLTFHGYACTIDCSGHEAGYKWAEEHGITDPDDCSGNSQSFIEGCKAYAEEHSGGSDSDEGDGE